MNNTKTASSITNAASIKKNYWLYVLKLEQEKYYIGITTRNVEIRAQEHRKGFLGARWTKKYKPIKIMDKKGFRPADYR